MGRKKKVEKAKEPVVIRYKTLANGNKSIYLDTYKEGRRSYEFLKMYLIPETDEAARIANENTMRDAIAIKSQRVQGFYDGKAGIVDNSRAKMLLVDWLDIYGEEKKNVTNISMLKNHIISYKGESVMMKDVDEAYCRGFVNYLANDAYAHYTNHRTGESGYLQTKISKNTATQYFVYFASAMNEAVRRKIIASNPTKYLGKDDKKAIKFPKPQRGYLTLDEVKMIINTDTRNLQVKQAFLFAVSCGLRISDIRALRWCDLSKDGKQWRASVVMKKTKERLELPLSESAMRWLPEQGEKDNTSIIFDKLPKSGAALNNNLKRLAKRAGIKKDICFHVSRHTFATALLTLGADLYTTSKLLGHTQISTTQIYADIVSKKKSDAVNVLGEALK